jgi:transcriptional regulator GlxA family with amidase domain
MSPRQHYLNARLQKAQDLLANTSASIKEIAEILGFESAYHLSHQFKSRVGVSPRQWRGVAVRHSSRCAQEHSSE